MGYFFDERLSVHVLTVMHSVHLPAHAWRFVFYLWRRICSGGLRPPATGSLP